MSLFRRALAQHRPSKVARRWVFVSYDQLSAEVGPLSREDPRTLGIVVVECPEKAARRPYHKQKLALVLANLRHFALEQAGRGIDVRHVVAGSYAEAVASVVQETGPLRMMRPAERELRVELAPLVASGELQEVPHEGWLTSRSDFDASQSGPPWRMDAFYRHVRRELGVLMEKGKPVGGRFSFDVENRRAWHGTPPAPSPPRFEPDEITREVCDLVDERMSRHPGKLKPEALPATLKDAERTWRWAKRSCLPSFGPFEDAMSTISRGLFHTRISPLLNLLRLPPARVVADVAAMKTLPLSSKEGFIRQVLGWREYMRHVHEATDGFRRIAGERQRAARAPGDGGWKTWTGRAWKRPRRRRRLARLGARGRRAAPSRVLGCALRNELSRSGREVGLGRRLHPPHHSLDGPLEHRDAPRRCAARADGLVLGCLCRRLRLGRRAERARDGLLRRGRAVDDEALRRRLGVHPRDE